MIFLTYGWDNPRRSGRPQCLPCLTTMEAAEAAIKTMEALREGEMQVESLQERFAR